LKKKRSPVKSSGSRTGSLEAIRRFERGETDSVETFDARGVRSLMVRDAEDRRRFRIESETGDGSLKVTTTGLRFPPSDVRPPELPPALPFIPGNTTVLLRMTASGTTAVRWEGPEDPVAVFVQASDQMQKKGWVVTASDDGSGPGPRQTLFGQEGATRKLVLFKGPNRTDVVLMEGKGGT
jgi:hypothetical protein